MNKKTITDSKELINIFRNTRKLSKSTYMDDTLKAQNDTKIYSDLEPLPKIGDDNLTIEFYKGGTLEIGTKFVEDYKTSLLNFADGRKPGGWPEQGCLTQEENLCRCTNLYEIITQDKCMENYYKVNSNNYNFGLCTDTIIYSPNICIFRDDNTYEVLPKKFADIITCPAPSCEFINGGAAYNTYVKRIEQILLSAIENKVECIVLGAWGCGAFRQDRRLVAKAFADVLNIYSRYFKKIVFAIKPTPSWSGQENTYDIFLDMFNQNYKGNLVEVK